LICENKLLNLITYNTVSKTPKDGHRMMRLHIKKIDGLWFGVANDEEKVFATTFGLNKETVLRNLLKSTPHNVQFQHVEKTSPFVEHVMALLRDIYDGKTVSPVSI
jgi:hypothetical protein